MTNPDSADFVSPFSTPLEVCKAVVKACAAVVMPLMLMVPAVMALSTAESRVEARLAATFPRLDMYLVAVETVEFRVFWASFVLPTHWARVW